jgi:hypothetical protein
MCRRSMVEPQSLWSKNIKFIKFRWQSKGERIKIWEKNIKKEKYLQ